MKITLAALAHRRVYGAMLRPAVPHRGDQASMAQMDQFESWGRRQEEFCSKHCFQPWTCHLATDSASTTGFAVRCGACCRPSFRHWACQSSPNPSQHQSRHVSRTLSTSELPVIQRPCNLCTYRRSWWSCSTAAGRTQRLLLSCIARDTLEHYGVRHVLVSCQFI